MPLTTGTKLGPYEIVGALGAGGMGEVYRARDTRLDRTVAIKILPPQLASDPQFRERFDREARAISSLDHPHICALYDVGQAHGVDFLVMQHLEGETLASRLAKCPLPIDQAIKYGVQIAEALDKAHRQGIVHRDLKPQNVMLTKAGAKLLDFGLSKTTPAALTSTPGISDAQGAVPTRQATLTAQGTILGTFQYMAPEQLEGREADARTDIFALGAVLYEMATGRHAFEGKSQASLIAAILDADPPPISAQQPLSPPALDHVVRKCLHKDPEDRWQSAHDLASELRWITEAGSQAGVAQPIALRSRSRERVAWIAAGVLALAATTLAVALWRVTAPAPPRPVKLVAMLPDGVPAARFLTLSADGQQIAFSGSAHAGPSGTETPRRQTPPMLWVRRVDSLELKILDGTERAMFPFWSPDAKWIAFFAQGKLLKVPATGGPAQVICDAPSGRGGTWNGDGIILFTPDADEDLYQVPAAGGSPTQVTKRAPLETSHRFPQFLPNGRHFTYVALGRSDRSIAVGSLDGGEPRQLLPGIASEARYIPGRLVYVRERTLVAQPFDAAGLRLTGDPVPIADYILDNDFGSQGFGTSAAGTVVYTTMLPSKRRLVWFDRFGKELSTIGEPDLIHAAVLSPDGTRIAIERIDPQAKRTDIWTLDPARDVKTRLTFDPASDSMPVWSPDGRQIAFVSFQRTGGLAGFSLFITSSSGGGAERQLPDVGFNRRPADWVSRGDLILFAAQDSKQGIWNLWTVPANRQENPRPYLQTPFNKDGAKLSPDGRWVAYHSAESGRNEVYVQSYPDPHTRLQVSSEGGEVPRWRGDGRELYFAGIGGGSVLAAPVNASGASLKIGAAKQLFHVEGGAGYDVARDGQRFLMIVETERPRPQPIIVLLNAFN
jgi:eukaryotic-like serine/threonine-protein kinase